MTSRLRIRWRAVTGFGLMVTAAAVLGLQAANAAAPNGLTVAAMLVFGAGLVAFLFHRADS